ncbi:hypothetical protein Tco_1022359 [Tanacetum coccineum]
MPTDPQHTPTIVQPSTSQSQLKQRSRRRKRKDTEVPQPNGPTNNVADKAVYEEMDDSLERAATTATSLDAEQDRGNINKTQSKATPNEPSSLGTSSGGGPRHQETMRDIIAQTGFENVSKTSNDSLLAGVNIPRRDYKFEIESQETKEERRVKTHGLKRLYKVGRSARVISYNEASLGDQDDASKQGRIVDIDADTRINIVSIHFDDDTDMFGVHDLVGDEVVIETKVASKDVNLSVDKVTLAQALAALKSAKPKADKVMLQEPEQGTITTTTASTRPKAKGLVIHEEEKATTPTFSSQQLSQVKVQDKDMDTKFVEGSEVRAEGSETRVEGSSKRAGEELEQESSKKQKLEEDKETTELQRLIEVVPDIKEVAIDAIPLATKPSNIVDYKINKEGKKTYYQIIKANGSSKMYLVFSHMLKSFDREDLETLWKLVKAKHGSTRLEEGYERVL